MTWSGLAKLTLIGAAALSLSGCVVAIGNTGKLEPYVAEPLEAYLDTIENVPVLDDVSAFMRKSYE